MLSLPYRRKGLIPVVMPFDGVNPRSIHHVSEVIVILNQACIVMLFLPPYGPDFNLAEKAFSYVKGYLKELSQAGFPLQYIIQGAFESITEKHSESWITDCGYIQ